MGHQRGEAAAAAAAAATLEGSHSGDAHTACTAKGHGPTSKAGDEEAGCCEEARPAAVITVTRQSTNMSQADDVEGRHTMSKAGFNSPSDVSTTCMYTMHNNITVT